MYVTCILARRSVNFQSKSSLGLRFQLIQHMGGRGIHCLGFKVEPWARAFEWNLASSGLTGEITNEFANLTELQTLDLSHNNLTGSIPDVLSQLSSLTLLDLTGNQLNGSIPSGLLKKSQDGSLTLRVGDNAKLCSDGTSCNLSKKKSNSSKIAIAIIVPIVVVVILAAVGTFIIYKLKRRPVLFNWFIETI
ncbi:putative LRR receptor-like serine/threonine-protein kinase [Carex littledalei]|uniref:Putative LRR receptor-like serine/threonine-protein kinase n=1 Tax=Carex littledalei TaxID=544730 RepID=A0A833QUW1_9POAL|nr:putative LRR receptor-like serine/threonine-protein kinase [Carex littledalei]